jgi:hypothetical protein
MADDALGPDEVGLAHALSLFDTLSDLSVISLPGSGAILYNPRFDQGTGLSENLRAVAIAAALRRTSVDAVRREYAGYQPPLDARDAARRAYVGAFNRAKAYIDVSLRALHTNPDVEMTLGMYAAEVALQRLQWSMFAAHLLYQLQLRFEADAVSRHVLEQISWSVAVAGLDDEAPIRRVQPQATIGGLRQLVPEAGRLYGALSSTTHAGIDLHRAVFEVDENQRGVIHHGIQDWASSAAILLTLADLWVVAHEYTQRGHVREIVACDPANDYEPVADRPFLLERAAMVREIQELEQAG